MTAVQASLIVAATVFASGLAGVWVGSLLPERHLTSETKAVWSASMAVVGTLTALVLGFLISSASTALRQSANEVVGLSTDLVQLDRMLRRYGPEADDSRVALRNFAELKTRDLFPSNAGRPADSRDTRALRMLEDLEDRILVLAPETEPQRWSKQETLRLTRDLRALRWALAGPGQTWIPDLALAMLTFWLAILFASFGLFAPRNPSAVVALLLAAAVVSGAILMLLEMAEPFGGLLRVSDAPMRFALEELAR